MRVSVRHRDEQTYKKRVQEVASVFGVSNEAIEIMYQKGR
ncbi:MAG: hypothetical protein RJA70_3232 [Pseudomonadota bacterium]|jgi:hypothetical protein